MTFSYCTSLTSIEIPNSVTEIGDWAFEDCTSLTSIEIPNSVIKIGYESFSDCSSLASIEIPSSVTEIVELAFTGCTSLTDISVDDKNETFSSQNGILYDKSMSVLIFCSQGLKGIIEIPNGVTIIDRAAFYNCTSLTSIKIPNSVTKIGDVAFLGCTSLTSIEISNSVTEIADSAFDDCTSLTDISVDDENEVFSSHNGILYDKSMSVLIFCPQGLKGIVEIPNGVTEIKNAFWNLAPDTSVIIPESVITISQEAFGECSPNITIYGVSDSYADTYAKENNINFTAINSAALTDKTSDIKVQAPAALPADTVLKVEIAEKTEDGVTYNITLTSNGKDVDLNGEKAIVKIPVPENGNALDYKVYRKEADGSYTNMNATPSGEYLLFFTEHFSEYVITAKNLESKPAESTTDEDAPNESTSEASTPSESVSSESTPTEAVISETKGNENSGGNKGESSPPTGIVFAAVPTLAAALGVMFSKKRK